MTSNNPQPWRDALVERIRKEAQPPEKFSHQARLYALAHDIAYASGSPVDDDVLFAAAWVHDLGVFLGHRPTVVEALKQWDSTAYTVAHLPAVLVDCGFPPDKIAAVAECVRTHEATGEPTTAEGIALRDADLLEQLGAIAVLRTAAKLAQDTRFITFADVAASLERALQAAPAQLRTARAKEFAVSRVDALRAFLLALASESKGDLS